MHPTSLATRGGINRIAGLSLYKSLLSRCRAVSLPDPHATELRNVLRNRFNAHRNAFGLKQLTTAFQTGYEALDILSKTASEGAAGAQSLQQLVSRIPAELRSVTRPSSYASNGSIAQSTAERTTAPSTTTANDPASSNVLFRPRALSFLPPGAHRHVPVWAEANGIPFLRTKKPVPNSLSGYIHKRIDRRQARTDRLALYEGLSMWEARCEDEWDDILGLAVQSRPDSRDGVRDTVFRVAAESEVTWTGTIHAMVAHLREQQGAEREKNLKMSRALLEVVRKERALAEQERRDRGRAKNRDRRRQKQVVSKAKQDKLEP